MAVLVERQGVPTIGAEHPVVIPFGGAEHDWAALELGAWVASAYDAPLRLLGVRGSERRLEPPAGTGRRWSSRAWRGCPREPVLIEHGSDGPVHATEGAGLVVVGLSERWRQRGPGAAPGRDREERRRHRSSSSDAGLGPGALAPRGTDLTRFSWSRVG